MLRKVKEWARAIKRDVHALWLAARDPRTPWYAKALALGIAAYALSPIDLIPDFIPASATSMMQSCCHWRSCSQCDWYQQRS
jgi:uncharacterized membrane protein YkvA (DUF1232 family)